MDRLGLIQKLSAAFEKYKFVILIVALGIFLMAMPEKETSNPDAAEPVSAVSEVPVRAELEGILSQIQGVGKVRVMITESTGKETLYQTDTEQDDSGDSKSQKNQTVVISDNDGETGLVRTVTPPTYLGAIVVCQGGDSSSVRLAVAQAVAAVTGISLDRITVLKMK